MAPKSSKSTRRSRSSRSVPFSRRSASESRKRLGRGEQARQRRHDEVEAEVVQLVRRRGAASCRSRPCSRPARRPAAPPRSPRAPRSTRAPRRTPRRRPRRPRPCPRQRLVEPDGCSRVGACGDVQMRAAIDRGTQLREPVLARHDLLAGHVPAPLRPHLVLEEDPGRARGLPELDRAHDVQRVAVAGVAVDDDHRLGRGTAHAPRHFGHLDLGEVAEVRKTELRPRHAVARQEDGVEARLGRETHREGVPHAWHQHRPAGRETRRQVVAAHCATCRGAQRRVPSGPCSRPCPLDSDRSCRRPPRCEAPCTRRAIPSRGG